MYPSKKISEIIAKLRDSEDQLSNRIADIIGSNAGILLDRMNTSWETLSMPEKAEILKQLLKEGISMRELVSAYKSVYENNKNILESIDHALLDYLDYFISL